MAGTLSLLRSGENPTLGEGVVRSAHISFGQASYNILDRLSFLSVDVETMSMCLPKAHL